MIIRFAISIPDPIGTPTPQCVHAWTHTILERHFTDVRAALLNAAVDQGLEPWRIHEIERGADMAIDGTRLDALRSRNIEVLS